MIHICDTGPIVAYLNRDDPLHPWALDVFKRVPAPLLTCEAVMTEAAYFIREADGDVDKLFELLELGTMKLAFTMAAQWPRLQTLMTRYHQMDIADACVVAMTEAHRKCRVITIDRRDFSTYRRNDRQVIDFIAPP